MYSVYVHFNFIPVLNLQFATSNIRKKQISRLNFPVFPKIPYTLSVAGRITSLKAIIANVPFIYVTELKKIRKRIVFIEIYCFVYFCLVAFEA